MYNGIGLETPRGSGTNGYVQRNWAAVRKTKDRTQYKTDREIQLLDDANKKQPNREILDHESKRKIENKCLELADVLEDQGYTPAEIAQKVDEYRSTLTSNKAPVNEILRDEYGRVAVRETHQIAEAQQEKNAKLREAFGISEYFVEGSSLDPQRKAKEALAKAAAEPASYALVKTPSPEKDVLKEDKRKLKSRDSVSSPEKKKEKKKKSKKRKKKSDHDSASKPKKKKKSSSKKSKKKKREDSSDDSSDSSDDSSPEKRGSSCKRVEKMKTDFKKRSESRSPPPRKEFFKSKYSPPRHRPRSRSESFDDYRSRNSFRKRKDKSPLPNLRRKESISPQRKKKSISPSYRKSKQSPLPYQHSKSERKKSVSPSSRKKKRSPSPSNRYEDRSISSGQRKERKSVSSSPLSFGRHKRSISPYGYNNKRSVSPKQDKITKNSWKKKGRHSSQSSSESKEKVHRSYKRKFSPNPPKRKHNKNVSRSRSRSVSPPPKKNKPSYYNYNETRDTENNELRKTNGSKYRSRIESRSDSHKKNRGRHSYTSSRSKSPQRNRSRSASPRKSRPKYKDSASKHRYDSKKRSSKSPNKELKHSSRKSNNRSRSSSSSRLSYSPLNKNPDKYRDILKSKVSQPQPQPIVRLRSFSSENEGGDSMRKKSVDEDKRFNALDVLQSELSAKVKESVEKKFSSNKNSVENSFKDKSLKNLPVNRSNDFSSSMSIPSKTQPDLTKKSPVSSSSSKLNLALQSSNRKLPSPAVIDEIEANKKANLSSKFVIDLDGSPKVKKVVSDVPSVSLPVSKKREGSPDKKGISLSPAPKSPVKSLKFDVKNQSARSSPASLKLSSPMKKKSPSGSRSKDTASPHLCRKSRKRDSNRSSASSSNDEDSPTRGSSSSDSSDSSHDSDSSGRSSSRSASPKKRSLSRSLSRDSKRVGSRSRSRSRSASSRSRSRSSSASGKAGSAHSVERRASRSSSRSVSPKRRSESRSVSRHSKRSASRSASRSHSSSRSRSRSPSIPRRKGSPSFLDRRRITSPKSKKYSSDSSSSSKSSSSSSSSSSTSDSD